MVRGRRELRLAVEREELTKAQARRVNLFFWLQTFTVILVAMMLAFLFLGRIIGVDGVSMVPTLHGGDMLVIQSVGYEPAPGDIVVLTKPFSAARGPIIKRIIATGGQHVEIDYKSGQVLVDGEALDEPYLNEVMRLPNYQNQTVIDVPEGSVFVMGDNRNHSADSRDITLGTVDERYILGCARLRFFPFSDIGRIE